MATTTTDTELLTEHFGYPPVSLLDDIINSINILAERALNSVEQGLLNAPPASLGFRPPTHASTTKPGKKPKKGEEGLPNAEEAHRHEIENGTHQLETLLCASIDRNFDKFEIYVMRNILCVRPEDRDWIRLGHYEGLDFSSPQKEGQKEGGDEKPTLETVTRLRRRLQASQKLNIMLHAEKARNAALLSEVRRLIGSPKQIKSERSQPPPLPQIQTQNGNDNNNTDTEMTDAPPPPSSTTIPTTDSTSTSKPPFGFLTQTSLLSTSDASTPLTTTTAFTLSQLDALRSLSTSLRSLLPALSQPVAATTPGPEPEPASTDSPDEPEEDDRKKKPWRLQRLEYIETATRKHLEQVRGLELGVNGELRDGGELRGEEQSITGDLMVVVEENGGDGDGDGDGARRTTKRRRVEREEVEALEGVLGSLGGGGHDGSSNEAGREGGEGGQGQEQEQEQEQNVERQEEGQIQAQSEGSQREGGEGETKTKTPRQGGGSAEKAKDQGDGEEGRMDES
ncbi:Mis12 protein-domain-containing protein [Neurospora crassa]|nr:Mis12 protein-domain-containing protein [Neurospora crassa]